MSTKTLNSIQKLSKVGRVLSKIVFILSLIISFCFIVGIVLLMTSDSMGIIYGDSTATDIFLDILKGTEDTLIAYFACSMVIFLGEAVLAKFAEDYFKHELEAGTPFTFAGANEMKRLGLLCILIPIGAIIISAIVYAILKCVLGDVGDFDVNNEISVALGIMFMVTSLICRHGAEISEKQTEAGGSEAGASGEANEK